MATVKLAPDEIEALFALIYELRDMPVQTREAAGELRVQHEAGRRRGLPRDKLKSILEPSATSKRPARSAGDGRDLGLQVADLRTALHRWTTIGEPPPSIVPTLIQFILITARADALEKAFLAAFCHHFGDEYANRYNVVVDRALELGVYPLPMAAASAERFAVEPAGQDPQAQFDDFSREGADPVPAEAAVFDASHDRDEDDGTGSEQTASVTTSDAADNAVDAYALQQRRRPADLPLAPDSRLTRKARGQLRPTAPTPPGRGFWGLFDGLRR